MKLEEVIDAKLLEKANEPISKRRTNVEIIGVIFFTIEVVISLWMTLSMGPIGLMMVAMCGLLLYYSGWGHPRKRMRIARENCQKYRYAAENHLWTMEQKRIRYTSFQKDEDMPNEYYIYLNDESRLEVNDTMYEYAKRDDKIFIVQTPDTSLPKLFLWESAERPEEYVEFWVKNYRTYRSDEKQKENAARSPYRLRLDEPTVRERLARLAAKNIKSLRFATWLYIVILLIFVAAMMAVPNILGAVFIIIMLVALVFLLKEHFKTKKEYSNYKKTGTFYAETAKCTSLKAINEKFTVGITGETMNVEATTTKEIYLSSEVGQDAYILAYGDREKTRCAYLIDANGQYIELQ